MRTPAFAAALPAAAALALSACASETATRPAAASTDAPRQCFFARNLDNYRAVSDSIVMLRVGVNDIYRAELFAPCPEIRFTEGVALRQTGGGAGQVCGPLDAEFVVPTSTGPRTCALTGLRKLTDVEIAALNPRDKP